MHDHKVNTFCTVEDDHISGQEDYGWIARFGWYILCCQDSLAFPISGPHSHCSFIGVRSIFRDQQAQDRWYLDTFPQIASCFSPPAVHGICEAIVSVWILNCHSLPLVGNERSVRVYLQCYGIEISVFVPRPRISSTESF